MPVQGFESALGHKGEIDVVSVSVRLNPTVEWNDRKKESSTYNYPMAWHGVALDRTTSLLTIYHMKYSVPDCGISRNFHK